MLQRSDNPLLTPPPERDRRPAIRTAAAKKRETKRAARQANAASQIGSLPLPGEELAMILTGDYHGWDIASAIIELASVPVDVMRVATLGFNNSQTVHLTRMIDGGKVRAFRMIVSEMFRDKNKAEFSFLREAMEKRGQVVACGRNHAKLMCFEFADGRKIVTHGSLNLRRCNSFEQVVISASEPLHDFFAAFIDEQAG